MGADFQQALVASFKLGNPSTVSAVPGGMTLSTWSGAFGPDTALQLVTSSDQQTPGVMVSYAAKK